MPRSTVQYPFEFKVCEWTYAVSTRLTGENRGLLMLMDERGAVRHLQTGETAGHFDLALKDKLIEGNPRWLFYHPFDAPDYTFIEWHHLEVAVLQRLIGKPFEPRDLISARDGKSIERIPTSWSVMF